MAKSNKLGKIARNCLVCDKSIRVTIYEDGHYKGGHYFNKVKFPVKGTGMYKKVGETKIGKMKVNVIRWTGKEKKVEYWECDKCYEEALHESWLEETLEKLFGKRCREYVQGCGCCEAWFLYDTIIDANRGRL